MIENESFLLSMFGKCIETAFANKELAEATREYLLARQPQDLDELDGCYRELAHLIEHKEKYTLIGRIDKAYEVIEQEQDPIKRQFYITKRDELIKRLEEIA